MAIGVIKVGELVRSAVGGVLMGLANLVPGISGGTMLLATGVYRRFVDAVAEATSFRLSWQLMITLTAIGLPAALSILLFAGLFRDLVLNYRWIMYSIFIGLTLGGVPVILAQIKKFQMKLLVPILCGIGIMILTALIKPGSSGEEMSPLVILLGNALGASAMVLPGISGGYILLVLGQYVVVLTGIDLLKSGLQAQDIDLIWSALKICIPVGIGVAVGVISVSHLVRFFFRRFEDQTYGVLLGLLVGAVFGLWPFQAPNAPKIGDTIRGQVLTTQEMVDGVNEKYYQLSYFDPSTQQVIIAILLLVAGFLVTVGIDRLGKVLEAKTS